MDFECRYDQAAGRYTSFAVTTESQWAPAVLDLADSGSRPQRLEGFANLEAGLVLLTHPTRGYFFRRDGTLGTYSIWHDRIDATVGRVTTARYPVLRELGLVEEGDVHNVHSVLIQPAIDFTIYLPPVRVSR